MLRSIACRCMEKDWTEDLGSKPNLCVLNSVYGNGLNGRCWKVQEKSHRRMLYRLRLVDRRVYLEKRGCVESVR